MRPALGPGAYGPNAGSRCGDASVAERAVAEVLAERFVVGKQALELQSDRADLSSERRRVRRADVARVEFDQRPFQALQILLDLSKAFGCGLHVAFPLVGRARSPRKISPNAA
jgi:hypothetical protein